MSFETEKDVSMIGQYIENVSSERLEHLSSLRNSRMYSEMVASPAAEAYEELVRRENLDTANKRVLQAVEDELDRRRRNQRSDMAGHTAFI